MNQLILLSTKRAESLAISPLLHREVFCFCAFYFFMNRPFALNPQLSMGLQLGCRYEYRQSDQTGRFLVAYYFD